MKEQFGLKPEVQYAKLDSFDWLFIAIVGGVLIGGLIGLFLGGR